MRIKGSNEYKDLKKFCAAACSLSEKCTGFEISTISDLNYNCAMYTENGQNLIKTSRYDFETNLLPDKAKLKFKSDISDAKKRSIRGLSIDNHSQQMLNSSELCSTHSKSCLGCTVPLLSSSSPERQICSGQSNQNFNVQYTENATLVIYPERALDGWVNFTFVANSSLLIRNNGRSTFTHEYSIMSANPNRCAVECLDNLHCEAVLWNPFESSCIFYAQSLWFSVLYNEAKIVHEPATELEYKVMIPNYISKIKNFRVNV